MNEIVTRRFNVFVVVVSVALLCIAIFAAQTSLFQRLPSPWEYSQNGIHYPLGPEFSLQEQIEAMREHQRKFRCEQTNLR